MWVTEINFFNLQKKSSWTSNTIYKPDILKYKINIHLHQYQLNLSSMKENSDALPTHLTIQAAPT